MRTPDARQRPAALHRPTPERCRTLGPKVMHMATSAASRPRAISTRPCAVDCCGDRRRAIRLRGMLRTTGKSMGLRPWPHSDVAQIAGAVPSRNVQTRHSVRERCAKSRTLPAVHCLSPRGLGGTGTLIVKRGHADARNRISPAPAPARSSCRQIAPGRGDSNSVLAYGWEARTPALSSGNESTVSRMHEEAGIGDT